MEKLIDGYINGLTNDFSHLGVSRSEMNEILRQLKIIFSSRKINGHNRHCDNEIFVYWSGYWIDCDLLHELHHVVQLYKTGKDDVTHKDSMWWNNMTNSTLV
jgi:hypothetical protein